MTGPGSEETTGFQQGSEYENKRWGLGEAPEKPEEKPRIVIDPEWNSRQFAVALIRANGRRLLAASSLIILFNIALMLLPVAVGNFVDKVVAPAYLARDVSEVSGPFLLWAGAIVAVYVVMNIGYRFGGRVGWLGVQRGQYELSQAVLSRVLDRRGFAGPRRPPGQLLAVSTGDTERACLTLYIMVYPPGEAVALVVAAITLSLINPWLGLGTIIGLPLMMYLLHQVAKPLRTRSMKEQSTLADAAAAAGDLMSGFRVIRGLHAQGTAADTYATTSRTALEATLSAREARARFDGVSTAGAQIFAAVLSLSAIVMALNGIITPGQLVTVTSVAVVLVGPLESLVGTLGAMWAMSQASAKRLLELMNTPYNPAALGEVEPAGAGTLELRELRLRDVSLDTTVHPGEFVILDLPQSAAAQLADSLTVRTTPTEGHIRLDGVPLTELEPHALRSTVTVLPHRPGIFAGTVSGNVSDDADTATEALAVAAVDDRELSSGHATGVGDGATELSGGQRQRIALARGVAASAPILVLLDPTTSVDAMTESLIAERLYEHRKSEGGTTVVVTSAPAFRAVADRVITATATAADSATDVPDTQENEA